MLAQFGFLGHDAAHRQIFASHHWNEWTARVVSGLFSGLSYRWWMSKHNRHHLNPNKGADPDLDPGAFAFTPSTVQSRRGLGRRLARWQGYYFFPLLLLEGLALHVTSVQTIVTRTDEAPMVRAAFIVVRLGGYVTVRWWSCHRVRLPPSLASRWDCSACSWEVRSPRTTPACPSSRPTRRSTFCGGGADVPQHPRRLGDRFALGGLGYQIEHHLFPSMPRPNLRRAQQIRDYCANHRVSYTETGLLSAYRIVVQYLSQVGLGAVTRSAARWSCSIGPRAPMGPTRGQPVADTSSPRPGRRPSAWSVLTGARRLLLEALDDRDCRGATPRPVPGCAKCAGSLPSSASKDPNDEPSGESSVPSI